MSSHLGGCGIDIPRCPSHSSSISEPLESDTYCSVRGLLLGRLRERAPGKIQLLAGPRQVGKTTLLHEIAAEWGGRAIYASSDAPEAELPGWADGIWRRALDNASAGPAVLLLDEVHFLPDWSRWLKARHDEVVRKKIPLHTLATGSSALGLGAGSRETMAGRFEKLSLHHWGAGALVDLLGVKWSGDEIRRRKSPPKLIALNNGLLLGGTSLPAPEPQTDPSRWGRWLENACLGPCLERRAARALLEGGTLGGGRGHPGRLGTVDRRGEDRTLHGGRSQGPRRRHNKISRILSLGHLRPRRGGASRGRRIPFHPLARLPAWRPESRTKRLGSGGMKTTAGPY
jgi:hypothetical protein